MPPPSERAGGGGLVEEDPDPERAEHGLEHAEEGGDRRGHQAGAGDEEREPEPEVERPEAGEHQHLAEVVASDPAQAAAKMAAKSVPAQTAGTIRTRAKRRTMTMVAEKPKAIQSASALPSQEVAPESEFDTMTPMPSSTAAIAAQVGPGTRSPNAAQAISAAISGAPAWTRRMFATVVYCSASTKAVDALPKRRATASPGRPIARKSASVPRAPSRTSMKPSRNPAAQSERQKTMVQASEVVADQPPEAAAGAPGHRGGQDQPCPGAGTRPASEGRVSFHRRTMLGLPAEARPVPGAAGADASRRRAETGGGKTQMISD